MMLFIMILFHLITKNYQVNLISLWCLIKLIDSVYLEYAESWQS